MNSTKGEGLETFSSSSPEIWKDLQDYYIIKWMKLFANFNYLVIPCLIFSICYIFVWIGHWGEELTQNTEYEIISFIFTLANSLYFFRFTWGIYYLRSIYFDKMTYQLLLKGDQANPQLKSTMNILFLVNLFILISLRLGEVIWFYKDISIWLYYFPMAIFHDIVDAFALTISLCLIISHQGILQLFMSQLRFNLTSIFYDGKSFVSHEFLFHSPFPSPPSHDFSHPSLSVLCIQTNPVNDMAPNESGITMCSSISTSTNSLSEYDIFVLFSQHYLHLHSTFHYLTVTYGKYLFFLIISMLCTILHLILYIYAYNGSSTSSIIESICSLYVIVVLMFNLAKLNVFGKHVQTLIIRKCIYLLTTLQSNPFLPISKVSSPYSSSIMSPHSPSSDIENCPSHSVTSSLPLSTTDRLVFYHQVHGFISSLNFLKLFFGFTRYFALDYNGLSALLLSLILSMIPRLLSNHLQS